MRWQRPCLDWLDTQAFGACLWPACRHEKVLRHLVGRGDGGHEWEADEWGLVSLRQQELHARQSPFLGRHGVVLILKATGEGRFAAPWKTGNGESLMLTSTELALFLEGCRLVGKVSLSPPEFLQG